MTLLNHIRSALNHSIYKIQTFSVTFCFGDAVLQTLKFGPDGIFPSVFSHDCFSFFLLHKHTHTNSNPFHINSATQSCVVNSKTYKVVSHEKLSFAFVRCSADVLDQRLNVLLHINFAYGLLDLFVTLLAKPLGKCKSTSKTDLKVSSIASRNAKIRHHC